MLQQRNDNVNEELNNTRRKISTLHKQCININQIHVTNNESNRQMFDTLSSFIRVNNDMYQRLIGMEVTVRRKQLEIDQELLNLNDKFEQLNEALRDIRINMRSLTNSHENYDLLPQNCKSILTDPSKTGNNNDHEETDSCLVTNKQDSVHVGVKETPTQDPFFTNEITPVNESINTTGDVCKFRSKNLTASESKNNVHDEDGELDETSLHSVDLLK